MNIAIIGAGVSGLTTAYYLSNGTLPEGSTITIYEKASAVGGNANTFNINLPDGKGGIIPRWVDMGVNDFNKDTYNHLVSLWQSIGIMNPDKSSSFCKPLINDESFSLSGGSLYRYTVEKDGSINVPPDGEASKYFLTKDLATLQAALKAWYIKWEKEGDAPLISVGEWAAQQGFSNEFIYANLYARINGMYYTQEQGSQALPPPANMPLWMVAHYYILQEGYGNAIENEDDIWSRQYFVNGSQTWLKKFADVLIKQRGIKIIYNNENLHVDLLQTGQPVIYNGSTELGVVDRVIFATHADDTLNMMDFKTRVNDPMIDALKMFSYDTCNVVVHQDASVLPPKGDCNKTYNIHIYKYDSSQPTRYPYTITYIVNYHQNDPAAGINDPLFYVTVNPFTPVNPALKLYQTNGQPAATTFKHVKLDANAMRAQVIIDTIQLHSPEARSFYYVGSFSRGAGLHEECIIQAIDIASKIINPFYVTKQTYVFNENGKSAPPDYILKVLKRKEKKH